VAYSFSQIKLAYECGHKFKKLYIEHEQIPGSLPALFGQAIHRIFHDVIVNNLERKSAIGLWRKYFEEEIANNDCKNGDVVVVKNLDFWMKRGYPVIQKFLKEKNKLGIATIIRAEEKGHGIYNSDEFSYVCDLVFKDNKNRLITLDYKTGKNKKEDYYQLVFYCLLMGVPYERLCLYYIWDGLFWFDGKNYVEDTKKYIDEGIKIIKSGKFEKNLNKYCDRCHLLKIQQCDVKIEK
jgi:hypothetical protein